MDQIIDILKDIGINETLFFQVGLFFIAWLAMNCIVFRPYLMAYEERIRRTLGSQEETRDILKQAEKKEQEYKALARKLNGDIHSAFAESNTKAKKKTEEILLQARGDSELQNGKLRKQMELSVAQARRDLENHIPALSLGIQKKFVEPLR